MEKAYQISHDVFGGSFGALGIAIGWLFVIIHLVSLESFGVPYMAPLAPTQYADLGDNFVVSCIWKHKKRPASIPHIWSDAPNGCDIFSTRWGSGFDEYPKRPAVNSQ